MTNFERTQWWNVSGYREAIAAEKAKHEAAVARAKRFSGIVAPAPGNDGAEEDPWLEKEMDEQEMRSGSITNQEEALGPVPGEETQTTVASTDYLLKTPTEIGVIRVCQIVRSP